MPVTELAMLRLKTPPPTSTSTSSSTLPSSFLRNLQRAATQQATFSKHPVACLHCIEDPSNIYLIGGWDTINQHMTEWIPSPTNTELMSKLSSEANVPWMFHVGCDPAATIELTRKTEGSGVVSVARHSVKNREGFQGGYPGIVDGLAGSVRGGREGVLGGWRADRGFEEGKHDGETGEKDELNEFILFTAWGAVQEHFNFGNTEAFQRWKAIEEFVERSVIQHGRMLFVAEAEV